MLTCIPFSWYYQSGDAMALLISAGITMTAGACSWWYKFDRVANVNKREGYLIVALGWLSMVTFGMLPYLISGVIPSVTDAFYEAMSGLTTTGSTVLTDVEAVPAGILYWRSLTQWIGGMGIIVLTVAIFPLLGIGGIELFVAESPGPKSDKIHPRIRETAKRLWLIYVALTVVLTIILWIGGMTFYDAINHAFTTIATGGFSTKNAGMGAYDTPALQYPIIISMFISGTNFNILYLLLKRRFRRAWQSDEFRVYIYMVVALCLIVTVYVHQFVGLGWEKSFRDSTLQVVSIITTTGFVSTNYTMWAEPLTMLLFILLFVGASAGSTSGGIKVIRHLVFFKNSFLEFKRILHPRAIVPLKLDGHPVPARIMTHVLVFLLIYLMSFVIGSIVVSAMGLDFMTAIGAVAASLSNVGPGIGKVGPMDNFSEVPMMAKWFLSFLMLLGRLELFTILVLFTPYFWKAN